MDTYPFHDPKTSTVNVSQYGAPARLCSPRRKSDSACWTHGSRCSGIATNPNLGRIPFRPGAYGTEVYPLDPVQWVTNGILTALGYDAGLTVADMRNRIGEIGTVNGVLNGGAFEMTGGTTTMAEMIATTKRGLLVTRLSDVAIRGPV